jgi:hypothetical protein
MQPVRQPRLLISRIPGHPPLHRRSMHPWPRRHLNDVARQNCTNHVQLLDNRQDNQCIPAS